MATLKSEAAKGLVNVAFPGSAGEAITQRYSMTVPTTVDADDILELAPIPPNCRVVDMVVDCDDLDTDGTPAITLDIGIMSGEWGEDGARTVGAEFFSGSNIAQAGGVARPSLATAYRTGSSDKARSIGVKIATVADAAQAGTIGITLTVAAA